MYLCLPWPVEEVGNRLLPKLKGPYGESVSFPNYDWRNNETNKVPKNSIDIDMLVAKGQFYLMKSLLVSNLKMYPILEIRFQGLCSKISKCIEIFQNIFRPFEKKNRGRPHHITFRNSVACKVWFISGPMISKYLCPFPPNFCSEIVTFVGIEVTST
jgi:hypothetical protein